MIAMLYFEYLYIQLLYIRGNRVAAHPLLAGDAN